MSEVSMMLILGSMSPSRGGITNIVFCEFLKRLPSSLEPLFSVVEWLYLSIEVLKVWLLYTLLVQSTILNPNVGGAPFWPRFFIHLGKFARLYMLYDVDLLQAVTYL